MVAAVAAVVAVVEVPEGVLSVAVVRVVEAGVEVVLEVPVQAVMFMLLLVVGVEGRVAAVV